jgi:S1-C subfamily serine protease
VQVCQNRDSNVFCCAPASGRKTSKRRTEEQRSCRVTKTSRVLSRTSKITVDPTTMETATMISAPAVATIAASLEASEVAAVAEAEVEVESISAAPAIAGIAESLAIPETTHLSAVDASLSPSPSLLREWSNPHPPVAPAVVLNEVSGEADHHHHNHHHHHHDGRRSGHEEPKVYSYPVATFVQNYVRPTVDVIRDHIGGRQTTIYAAAVPADGDDDHDDDAAHNNHYGLRSSLQLRCTLPPSLERQATATATTHSLDMLDSVNAGDDDGEFVLIDGDLVALPSSATDTAEQGEMDFWERRQQREQCRGGRMRRGVKGLKKWIKKNKIGRRLIKHHKDDDTHSQSQDGHQQNERFAQDAASTTSVITQQRSNLEEDSMQFSIDVATVTSAASSTVPDPGSDSPNGKKQLKPKKKKRLAWLRDIEKRPANTLGARSPPRQRSLEPTVPLAPDHQASPAIVTTTSAASVRSFATPAVQPAFDPLGQPSLQFTHDLLLNRQASIAAEASFVGNADQLLEAGVLPDSVAAEAYIEDRLDDYDKYDKKDAGYPYLASVVPRDADYKVDKLDAPCVDSMLVRAGEYAQDLEASTMEYITMPRAKIPRLKSDGSPVPLSMATAKDEIIHNDILKLVMVGAPTVDKSGLARSLRQSTKKTRKRTTLGVDVHTWSPFNPKAEEQVKFSIWDVQGAKQGSDQSTANFGAHPGTQSLFFSDRALYILVWDLAALNRKTFRRDEFHDDSEEEEEEDNEYIREQANRQADLALRNDIEDRVLSWVDCIARRGHNSAILPVALVPSNMAPDEAKRRCDVMTSMMMDYTEHQLPKPTPKVLTGADTMICVSLETNMGMDLLEETILAIATDAGHSVFDHVGTPVPVGTIQVLETARRLKEDHKLVLVDHLMGELGDILTVEDVMEALHFLSSIGELLYFEGIDDDYLSRYVILSRKWLVSALSCILRNDLKRELTETRRFMNMQCIYSDQQFPESHVTQTFSTSTSQCPVLSSTDTQMLWQSMSFMREAADRSSQLSETSTSAFTMFGFLERLLLHTGVFLPLEIDPFSSPPVYFVPSLLSQTHTPEVWTFKSSESWMANLSNSWLFRDGAPVGLFEHITVALLRDLYEFSRTISGSASLDPHPAPAAVAAFASAVPLYQDHQAHHALARSQSFPLARHSMNEFIETHDGEPVGHIKIHQIMCWKSSLLVKIGCVFPEGNTLRESFVEIFVCLVDQSSPHCVASDAMQPTMQRVVISGKGQVGHHGRKLWKGGYGLALDSIKASLAHCANVDYQVVCPECLAHAHPNSAATWSWDSVRAAAESGSTMVRCMHGHRVDSNLICGTSKPPQAKAEPLGNGSTPKHPTPELLPSVVVVGLWDSDLKAIRNVGSGFVVDKKQGLVVTAGHVLFNMEDGRNFGTPYFGLPSAKAVIGVIPEGGNGNTAKFRYFAEIVAEDIRNVDACVLRITTRMENDADSDVQIAQQVETPVDSQLEKLHPLKMTRRYELEESVRILGFNQGGEGILEQGKHVNRSADVSKGYICKQFKLDTDDHSSSSESSSTASAFAPREEIVIMCHTISGHSGGPCVNEEGKVVGILSRADPVDRQRAYLVPSTELKILVNKARSKSSRGGLKMYAVSL